MNSNCLFSMCLLGVRCRYDGRHSFNKEVFEIFKREGGLVFCPEQVAGFSTPRPKIELSGGDGFAVLRGRARVVRVESREDVTEKLVFAARKLAELALAAGVKKAFLKAKSPSCGVSKVYIDGVLCEGCGVFAAALKEAGVELLEF